MRGYGYECDYCGRREIVEGDPFLGADPLPPGWLRVIAADDENNAWRFPNERGEYCSWDCVRGEAGKVEERRTVQAEKAKRAAMEAENL